MSVPSRVSCLCPKKGPPKLPTLEKPSHWQSLQSLQSSLRTKVLICKTLRRPQAAKLAEIFFGGKVFWGGKSWWGFVIFGWVVFWSFVCGYFRYRFTIYKHPGGGGDKHKFHDPRNRKTKRSIRFASTIQFVCVCKGASFLPNILPNSSTVPLL